jgi:hypothetical protein
MSVVVVLEGLTSLLSALKTAARRFDWQCLGRGSELDIWMYRRIGWLVCWDVVGEKFSAELAASLG